MGETDKPFCLRGRIEYFYHDIQENDNASCLNSMIFVFMFYWYRHRIVPLNLPVSQTRPLTKQHNSPRANLQFNPYDPNPCCCGCLPSGSIVSFIRPPFTLLGAFPSLCSSTCLWDPGYLLNPSIPTQWDSPLVLALCIESGSLAYQYA